RAVNGPTTRDAEEIDFTAEWVKEHYKDECFIVVERGSANENGDGILIPFSWASGAVTLRGIIDSATANIDFELGSTVPLYGYQKLCALRGNLRQGIVGTYDGGAGSGMITMFHKGRDVWLDVSFKSIYSRVDRSSFIVSLPKVRFFMPNDDISLTDEDRNLPWNLELTGGNRPRPPLKGSLCLSTLEHCLSCRSSIHAGCGYFCRIISVTPFRILSVIVLV
ncbi:hypothetical protein BKA62DRAFT_618895, partial [Auriculariales sp. MPI-PUGE-AT-0066]